VPAGTAKGLIDRSLETFSSPKDSGLILFTQNKKERNQAMKKMTSGELRTMWLNFFKGKGHAVIPSASVIPENDPTVLFTTAGMHPLVPYLLGSKHPAGTRLTDVQKCIRTGDIDEVGDASHLTFFEMLGNWSLGDYFKKDMIAWSWEFLTSEEYLGLDKDKLAFTVFEGEGDIPRDDEAAGYWMENGVKPENIFISDVGRTLEIGENGACWGPNVPSGRVLVDGYGVGDVGAAVLRERKVLSESGVITAVVGVDMRNRTIISGPEIISRGFVFVREAEELMSELKALTLETMENCLDKGMTSRNAIKDTIARRLSDYLYKKTKREPLIVPILMEL